MGACHDPVMFLSGKVAIKDRTIKEQSSYPPSAMGSPYLPAQGSPSLTPRLSIPCLPEG